MPAGDVCHVMPLGGPANGCRCQSVRWCLDSPARRLPCTGLPCREPCLPAPSVRPWCSGRCTGRTSACTSKRTSCAGAPAVARRGAGSVWNALHGPARPARPDIGGRHPQASSASSQALLCHWQKSKANPPVKRQAAKRKHAPAWRFTGQVPPVQQIALLFAPEEQGYPAWSVSMVRVLHRPAPWESPCGCLGRLHGHVRHHCRPAGCWDSLPAVGAPP